MAAQHLRARAMSRARAALTLMGTRFVFGSSSVSGGGASDGVSEITTAAADTAARRRTRDSGGVREAQEPPKRVVPLNPSRVDLDGGAAGGWGQHPGGL